MLTLAQAIPDQKVTLAGAIAGDAVVADLRQRAEKAGLHNVRVVGNPSEAEVATLLTSHEIFVFPVPWEHFGIVTVEAIQAGLLPLVHDSGGQKEIVPIDSLRFANDQELINQVKHALDMPIAQRFELVSKLQEHTERGSSRCYREAMLRELKELQ